jgi:copper(I)-binding protein
MNIDPKVRASDWREARSRAAVLLTTVLAVVGLTVAATGGAVALQTDSSDSGTADFGQNVYTADRGDTVDITVEFDNTNTSTVQIGDPDNSGYHVTAQVEDRDDDGEAVVTFDSETAGSDQQVLSAAGDDAVTNVTQGGTFDGMNEPAGSDILEAGDYRLYVTAGEKSSDQITDADARATLSLEEGEPVTGFENSVYTAERGYNVDIGIEFTNTDTATVQVGTPDGSGYHVTAQVEDRDDDGEAVVTFDSETAGSDQQVLTASDGDAIANVTQGGPFDGTNEPAGSDILEAGDYELHVGAGEKSSDQLALSDTQARATLSLEERERAAAFEQNVYTADRGDTVDITVEFTNTDTTTVQVGDPDDSGYHVTAQVEDRDGDGEATVTFDSETAGSDQQVLAPSDGDAVSDVTQGGSFDGTNEPAGSDMLAAADYDLYVTAGEKSSDQITDPDARATLSLEEAEEPSASFDQSVYTVERGSSVNITVEFDNTDTATVQIGDSDTNGYHTTNEVVDLDGDGKEVVAFDGENADGDRLDAGDYDLYVTAGEKSSDQITDADDRATVSLEAAGDAETGPDNETGNETGDRTQNDETAESGALSLTAASNPTLDGTVRVQFTLENTGGDATAVTLNASDVIAPDALSLSNHSSDGGVWQASTQTWLFQDLEPDESVTAAVDVAVDSNASEQTVTGTANGNGQEVSATATVDRDGLATVQAVDSNDDGKLDDTEVVQAINSWRNDDPVGDSNQTITDEEIREITNLWEQGGD